MFKRMPTPRRRRRSSPPTSDPSALARRPPASPSHAEIAFCALGHLSFIGGFMPSSVFCALRDGRARKYLTPPPVPNPAGAAVRDGAAPCVTIDSLVSSVREGSSAWPH